MAEFSVAMKQIQRFCGSQIKCESCPVWHREDMCCKVENAFRDGELSDGLPEIERIVMDWAAKHPEPRYPTWKEWQNANFPTASYPLGPCGFVSAKQAGCELKHECVECLNSPIPADIAQKLGIKLIGGIEHE